MPTDPLRSTSGVACITGGALIALCFIVHPFDMAFPFGASGQDIVARRWTWEMVPGVYGFVAVVIGLPGLYARTAERTGWAGRVGTLMALIGTVLFTGVWCTDAFYVPLYARQVPALFDRDALPMYQQGSPAGLVPAAAVNFLVGHVLLAVSLARARFLPVLAAACLAAGALALSAAPALPHWAYSYGPLLYGLGMVWAGLRLLRS